MKKLNAIISLLFITWLSAFLGACNLGEVDLNAPNLNATYTGEQESVYRAVIDNVTTYYSADTYICTDAFLYSLADVSVTVNNTDLTPVACEVSPVTRITVVNDNAPYIR